MALDHATEMSRRETDDLLSRHETGVLALARAGDPYAVPISYGYDASAGRFYLRLVSTPDSEKRAYLGDGPAARLVVYEEDGDTYRSVIATGHLTEIDHDELTVERIEQFGDAKRPLFEVWALDTPDLDVALYQLDPDHVSGRRIEVDRDGD